MDETRPLLNRQHENIETLPNLRQRHEELIPTPCGPIKQWSELLCFEKASLCFTFLSMLVLLILIIFNIVNQTWKDGDNDDLSVSLIQLVGIGFCVFYITRGVLQENKQELIIFSLCVLLVMGRAIVNFIFTHEKKLIMIRFVCILCIGVVHLICNGLLIRRCKMMAFRVGGALDRMQMQYTLLNRCFSMVTFDLQAQLCLCILILTSGRSLSSTHEIILGIGVAWAIITAVIGCISILKELKIMVLIFVLMNVPELAYFIYLLYSIISDWGKSESYTLEAAAITGCVISVFTKAVLFRCLFRLYRSFGQGLQERMSMSRGGQHGTFDSVADQQEVQ